MLPAHLAVIVAYGEKRQEEFVVYCWAVCLLEASFYVVMSRVQLKYFMISFSF